MVRLDPTSKKTDSYPDQDPILSFNKNPDLSKTPVSKIEVEIPYEITNSYSNHVLNTADGCK